MTWTHALAYGAQALASQRGEAQGRPRITREQAAGVVLAGRDLAAGAGLAWPWQLVGLAVLGYRTRGDRFGRPVASGYVIDPAYGAQLVDVAAGRYLWSGLDELAAGLDAAGVPVPKSGGALAERLFQAEPSDVQVKRLATDLWEWLQSERAAGRDPTWVDVVLTQDDPGSGSPPDWTPPGPGHPPLPRKPPPPPVNPVPPGGGGSGAGWIVVGLALLYLFDRD